ncbi:MAG: hypothetical protein ACI4XL_12115 [Bacillus sp. (in: firmicutes)]
MKIHTIVHLFTLMLGIGIYYVHILPLFSLFLMQVSFFVVLVVGIQAVFRRLEGQSRFLNKTIDKQSGILLLFILFSSLLLLGQP